MRRLSLNNKGFAPLLLLIGVAAVLVVGGGGAYVYHKNHKPKTPIVTTTTSTKKSTQTTNSSTASTTSDTYAGWSTYKVGSTGLTFRYPNNWTVNDTPECDGAHNYEVFAPSSEVSGLTGVTQYGLAVIANAEVAGTSSCAPSVSTRAGIMLGSQSHSALISAGVLKGKYIVVNGASDGTTSGTDVLNSAYGSGQKITETGLLNVGSVDLQITSALVAGQNPAAASATSFLSSQLYTDTVNILNSFTTSN